MQTIKRFFRVWKFNQKLKKTNEFCMWTKDKKCHPRDHCNIEMCENIIKTKEQQLKTKQITIYNGCKDGDHFFEWFPNKNYGPMYCVCQKCGMRIDQYGEVLHLPTKSVTVREYIL